jgi:predicted nucleic acid-binding protein
MSFLVIVVSEQGPQDVVDEVLDERLVARRADDDGAVDDQGCGNLGEQRGGPRAGDAPEGGGGQRALIAAQDEAHRGGEVGVGAHPGEQRAQDRDLLLAEFLGNPAHGRQQRLAGRPLLVPATVVAEVGYMLAREAGARVEALFLTAVADGDFQLVDLTTADIRRAAKLVQTYGDMPLGTTDATVIALAERVGVREVATLDRRHFSVVRPSHVEALTLLP